MDPIETWHDAPEFERMDAKIKSLERKLSALVLACNVVKNGIDVLPINTIPPVSSLVAWHRVLKQTLSDVKE